jgi:hypothetical protein
MGRYSCILMAENDEIMHVKEITADFDVKAVLLARAAATRLGCRRFELRQQQRLVRREDSGSICLGDEYGTYMSIALGDELKD